MSPQINHIGFGVRGHVRKFRNHRNEGFEGSHISKSKSYKFKLRQNSTTELLSKHISFKNLTYKLQKNRNKGQQCGFFVVFYRKSAFQEMAYSRWTLPVLLEEAGNGSRCAHYARLEKMLISHEKPERKKKRSFAICATWGRYFGKMIEKICLTAP